MTTLPSNIEVSEASPPVRFISLSVHAGEVFANQEKALVWLQTPNPSLQNMTPLEAARTEDGYAEAQDILTRIAYGVIG